MNGARLIDTGLMQTSATINKSTRVTLLLCSTLAASCATTISAHRIVPAEAHQLADVKSIAVAPFQHNGADSESATSIIEATLFDTRVAGEPYFSLVERGKLDLLIEELRLEKRDLRGFFNERSASELRSKLSTSDAILFGDITYDRVDLDDFNREEDDGTYISCIEKTATFTFVPKFMDISSGNILYSKEFSGSKSGYECAGETGASEIDLKRSARNQALDAFKRAVAPYSTSEKLRY